MTNQTNTIQPGLTFKTAVLFRRAMTEGGLYAQMMPGVFTTAEALADGIKTHKALARETFVYMPVDVALDDKGSPTAVEPNDTKAMIKALGAALRAGEGPEAMLAVVGLIDGITNGDDDKSSDLLTQAIEHFGDRTEG